MKIQDITEYGSSGPYNQGMTTSQAGNKPGVTTAAKPGPGAKQPQIPLRAKTLKPIRSPSDLPDNQDNPQEPFGIYDPKDKKLVGIAINQGGNKPPAILDPKTKKPMKPGWAMLRSLGVDPSATKTESVWSKFMALPLAEQLRIVEHIDVSKLNRITGQE